MGADHSVPISTPTTPWVHPRLRQSILDISDSSEAFLHPDPQYYQQFDLNDAIMPHLKGALIHDPRCNMWLAKLVPKRISEVEFWRNYFSHVAAVNAKAPVKKLRSMQRHSETGAGGHSGAASGVATGRSPSASDDSSSSDESSSDDEPGEHSRPITHHSSQTSTSHPSQLQMSASPDAHSLEPPQQPSRPTTPPSTSQSSLPPRASAPAPPRPPNVEINSQSVECKRGSVISPLTRAPSPLLPQNARIGPDGAIIDEQPPPASSCCIS